MSSANPQFQLDVDAIGSGHLAKSSIDISSLKIVNHDGRTAFFITVGLFLSSLLVFCVSPVINTSDSMYSMVLSESILHRHSTHLDWVHFPAPIAELKNSTPPTFNPKYSTYPLGNVNGHIVYCFPNGSSLLSVPFVAIMNGFGANAIRRDGSCSLGGEVVIQKMLSALLMALLTCLIFRAGLFLLTINTSTIVALSFAFGTPVWSTATRALWSHTWFIFLGGIVVYLLLRTESQVRKMPSILIATLLSWMYFVRPTGAVPIVCVAAFLFVCHRGEFKRFAAAGALWFGAFTVYSWFTFDEVIPGYYLASRLQFRTFPIALAGILVSPSRGLFLYVPMTGFITYVLIRYRHELPYRRLLFLSLSVILVHGVCVAGYPNWWGGASYGPRLLTDVLPWFAVLAILGLAGRAKTHPLDNCRLELATACCLVALSIAINGRGAFSVSTQQWSTVVDVDRHPEHIFDWSYPQFAAGLIPPPDYVVENINRLRRAAAASNRD